MLDLILFIVWIFLFIWRKDIRKRMLFFSAIFSITALILEPFYRDWWTPLKVTSLIIEDILFGFLLGGIAEVIYEVIYKKRVKVKKIKNAKKKRNINFLLLSGLVVSLFFASYYLLGLNSFYSSIIALFIPTLVIWINRKDLVIDSIVTGFLLLIITFSAYFLLNLITPGWVEKFWLFQNIPKVMIFHVPLEDVIWYFFVGMLFGPLYEYWKEGKLINLKK